MSTAPSGTVTFRVGDLHEAEQKFSEAIRRSQGVVPHVEITCGIHLGLLQLNSGDHERALETLLGAIGLNAEFPVMPADAADAYDAVASIPLDREASSEACVIAAAANAMRKSIGVSGYRYTAELRETLWARLRQELSRDVVARRSSRGDAMSHDEVRRFVADWMSRRDGHRPSGGDPTFQTPGA